MNLYIIALIALIILILVNLLTFLSLRKSRHSRFDWFGATKSTLKEPFKAEEDQLNALHQRVAELGKGEAGK